MVLIHPLFDLYAYLLERAAVTLLGLVPDFLAPHLITKESPAKHALEFE
jgi:hypothetical protein